LLSDNQLKTIRDLYSEYKTDPNQFPRFKNTLKNIAYVDPESKKVFLKLFVFNSDYTKEGWRGNPEYIPENIKMSLGHPLAIASDYRYIFAHPGSQHFSYEQNENFQRPFIIGKSIKMTEKDTNGDFFNIYEITDPIASDFFREIAGKEEIPIPFFSSPQVVYGNTEDETNIKRFKIQHNILTDSPQFGESAKMESICFGESDQCLPILAKQAGSQFELESIKCNFCIIDRLAEIFKNNIKTIQYSSNQFLNENNKNMSINESNNQSQNANDTNNTNTNQGQPIKSTTTTETGTGTTTENKNQNQEGYKIDMNEINELIKKNINEFLGDKKQKETVPTIEGKSNDSKTTIATTTTTTGTGTAGTEEKKEESLKAEIPEELQKRITELENKNKVYEEKINRDNVANLLLDYFRSNHAFTNNKGELDETRFTKALDYWSKSGKQTDEIKEIIEMANLMYAPTQNKIEITKKASSNDFETKIFEVPHIEESKDNKIINNKDDKPYYDRTIARNYL
jgi:hypothetical protein